MQDHYQTLGVARDASQSEIRTAYRKAASEAHPDRPGGCAERMQAVNVAFEVLGNPERRAAYDRGEGEGSPDAIAREILRAIFTEAISDDADDVLRYSLDKLHRSEIGAREKLLVQRNAIARMEKQRQRITAKGERDMYHSILENAISKAKDELKDLEQNIVHVERVRELLKAEYERGTNCPEAEMRHGRNLFESNEMADVIARMGGFGFTNGRSRFDRF